MIEHPSDPPGDASQNQEHGLLSNPSPVEQALSLYETNVGCMAEERSFKMNTASFVGLPPPQEQVESVGWSFSKDGRGRGGLIGYGNSSRQATVSFDLPCAGARRVLDIGYLKSYSGMGAVKVEVRGSDGDTDGESDAGSDGTSVVVVDGLWESRASVLEYAAIPTPSGFDTIRVTFEAISSEAEASYSSFLSDAVGSEADSVRIDRKFTVVRMQCC